MKILRSMIAALALATVYGCASIAPPPEPAPKRFQIFFDYDSAVISKAAAEILRQVADQARRDRTTGLYLTVQTLDGARNAYDHALSERRAEAVKAELVKAGVPPEAVTFLLTDLTDDVRPTTDGIREPQNRSTKIILR